MLSIPPESRLTPIGVPKSKKVKVRCICGTTKIVYVHNLCSGKTLSCGCLAKERTRTASTTHGQSSSPTYRAWRDMQNRCYRKNNKDYADYGGRGIRVHRTWRGPGGFEVFVGHVGLRPSQAHSLDRRENSKGYVPGNVKWSTRTEQMRNTRRTLLLNFRGISKPLQSWCDELGLSFSLVYQRIYSRGWPVAKALTTPSSRAHGLDEAKAFKIRERRRRGFSVPSLAAQYHVSESAIYDVCSGRTW